MTYDQTGKGALFKNVNKQSDRHPDYKGNINIDGKDYWLSAWVNESREGMKYLSLSAQAKEEKKGGGGETPPPPSEPAPTREPVLPDDVIPFISPWSIR